jgi:hypothetical protein
MSDLRIDEVTAEDVELWLGAPLSICAIVLCEIQSHIPEAKVRYYNGNNCKCVSFLLPYGDTVTIEQHRGFTVIEGSGGTPVGVQYFVLVPLSDDTSLEAVGSYTSRVNETQVILLGNLTSLLNDAMQRLYTRITDIRMGAARRGRQR